MLFRWVFPFGFRVITVYGLLISIVCMLRLVCKPNSFLRFPYPFDLLHRLVSFCFFDRLRPHLRFFRGFSPVSFLRPLEAAGFSTAVSRWPPRARSHRAWKSECAWRPDAATVGGWGVAKARVSDRSMSTSIYTYRCIYTSTLWLRHTHTYLFVYVYINIYLYTYIYRYILIYICCYII